MIQRKHIEGLMENLFFAHLMHGVKLEISSEQLYRGRMKFIPNGYYETDEYIYDIQATASVFLEQAQIIIEHGKLLPGGINLGEGQFRDQFFSKYGVIVRERFLPK